MSSTKLIVLKSKELIYTAILLALIVVFVIILINMFKRNDKSDGSQSGPAKAVSAPADPGTGIYNTRYTPGTYSSPLIPGENTLSVIVTVDDCQITDVSFQQMDETITTMYPLLESSLEDINTQLHYISSVDDIIPSGDSTYTTKLIIDSIKNALKEAVVN